MKLISWNVNGVRAVMKKGFMDFLVAHQPDIICLQEIKVHNDDLPEEIPRTYYGSAWSRDSTTYFYTRPDDAMRPHQLWRHRLGTAAETDVLVFQEDDERFSLQIEEQRVDGWRQGMDGTATGPMTSPATAPSSAPRYTSSRPSTGMSSATRSIIGS